ncbi:hypothetical protein BH11ARM2_BH11ARM2_16370 [soil metagenome]
MTPKASAVFGGLAGSARRSKVRGGEEGAGVLLHQILARLPVVESPEGDVAEHRVEGLEQGLDLRVPQGGLDGADKEVVEFGPHGSGVLGRVLQGAAEGEHLLGIGEKNSKAKSAYLLSALAKKGKGLRIIVDADSGKAQTMPVDCLARVAYRPWADPRLKENFVYGPSLAVNSVRIAGTAPSKGGKKQDLMYATAEGFGSCPYLYIWSEEHGMWLGMGRTLVRCVGAKMAKTDRFDLATPPSRIVIREREAETTHLDSVSLDIEDGAGGWVHLLPVGFDGTATIREGEEQECRFDIPESLRHHRARLNVSGYYERNPRIQWIKR